MITAFPKIFSIGTDYIRDVFKGLPEWYKEQLFAKVFEEAEA